tara:strand:+ start:52 stop:504 length:453 start_codon:yes stop_codon:yes gene_type:complete
MEVPNYSNYKIYRNGDVENIKTKRILKPTINSCGYKIVSLVNNKKKKNFLIHRLLGLCYIENPENKLCVDHINRIRSDNRLKNLRWATYRENSLNASLRKDNKLKEKYIFIQKNGYVLDIPYLKISKYFSTKEYDLEYVKIIRDAIIDEI